MGGKQNYNWTIGRTRKGCDCPWKEVQRGTKHEETGGKDRTGELKKLGNGSVDPIWQGVQVDHIEEPGTRELGNKETREQLQTFHKKKSNPLRDSSSKRAGKENMHGNLCLCPRNQWTEASKGYATEE